MEASESVHTLPRLWCDFNAVGWSGDPHDDCYYVFDQAALSGLSPYEGLHVFVFMYDDQEETEITGCEAVLEAYDKGWRIRPDTSTWCSGRRFW